MGEYAFALDASELSAPGITFWTAWNTEALAGFAALRQLDSFCGEIKSMRVAPAARGTGIGRALLAHLVTEAKRRFYTRLYLETGTAELHAPAIALYRSAGFSPCNAFADYQPSPHNQFMQLFLPN